MILSPLVFDHWLFDSPLCERQQVAHTNKSHSLKLKRMTGPQVIPPESKETTIHLCSPISPETVTMITQTTVERLKALIHL